MSELDRTPVYTDAVMALMSRTDELVPAAALAPILKMHPSVIIRYAKDGTWDQEHLGKYVISGNRVKFFRKDFLQKCGFIEPDPEYPSTEQMLQQIWEAMMDIRILLKAIANEKTAGCWNSRRQKGVCT